MTEVRQVRLAGREVSKKRSDRKPRAKSESHPDQITTPDLEAHNELETMPAAVQHGRMVVTYVRPHFEREKDDKRFVGLEISLPLTNENKPLLPREVTAACEALESLGAQKLSGLQIGGLYSIELGLAPEGDDRDLEIKIVQLESMCLAVVEQTGTGESTDIMRLSFRVVAELDGNFDTEKFACRQFGKQVWMKLEAIQGELLREAS